MAEIIVEHKDADSITISKQNGQEVVIEAKKASEVTISSRPGVVIVMGTASGSTDVDTAAILSQVQSQLDSRVAATIKPVSDKVAEHTQQIADLAEAVGDGCKKEWITLTEYKARLAAGTLEDDMTYLIENVNQDDEAL